MKSGKFRHLRGRGANRAIRFLDGRTSVDVAVYCRCGKVRHQSRKSAKHHAKMLGKTADVYRCKLDDSVWHVGWTGGLPILFAFEVALRELAGLRLSRGRLREI